MAKNPEPAQKPLVPIAEVLENRPPAVPPPLPFAPRHLYRRAIRIGFMLAILVLIGGLIAYQVNM